MGQLTDRTALITGGSRGIGAAVARRYALEGARVVVNHHPESQMSRLALELVDELRSAGHDSLSVPADISDPAQVDEMMDTIHGSYGDVDILVANAAVFPHGPWADLSVEDWDRTFDVNVRGAFLCARAAHPGMLRRGGGSIITVSSVTVHLGSTDKLAYVATKGALIGFTRALAREIGQDGIRVNCVMPGAIKTEHELDMAYDREALEASAAEFQSIPRRGLADDLAGTFVYLASEDSAFVTGQVVAVDGGWVHR